MTAVIRGTPSLAGAVAGDIQAAMKNINSTAYIRVPLRGDQRRAHQFPHPADEVRDDGFVAYLNGVAVASRNAPVTPEGDVELRRHRLTSGAEAIQFEDFDLTPVAGLLRPGANVLAIHG